MRHRAGQGSCARQVGDETEGVRNNTCHVTCDTHMHQTEDSPPEEPRTRKKIWNVQAKDLGLDPAHHATHIITVTQYYAAVQLR